MVAMTLPAKPWVNGMMTADGTRMFDSTVGSEGAWRATPIPAGGLPAGSIIQWSSNTAPPNWFIADGSAISRTLWPSLFAVIGTTYGSGDGSTTFNLPDLRGRVAVGRDGSQTEFDVLGETGGSKTHRHDFKIALFDSGNYGVSGPNAAMGGANQGGAYRYSTGAYQGGLNDTNITLNGEIAGTASSRSLGRYASTGDTDTGSSLQPYLVTNYIIKATTGWSAGDSELALRMAAAETKANTTNKSGLVPIVPPTINISGGAATSNSSGFITFNSVSQLSLNNCFSSLYANYKVLLKLQGQSGGAGAAVLRLRNAGVDYSGGNYHSAGGFARPTGGVGNLASSTGTFFPAVEYVAMSDWTLVGNMDIFDPFITDQTTITDQSWNYDAVGPYAGWRNGMLYTANSYDGFSIIPSGGGNLSGTIQVLGYNA